MPQSVHQIKEQLLKATDKDGNVKDMKTTLEIFSVLEKLPITKEDLEMTRLGLHINIIRKAAKSPDIASRAKKLIKSWQKKFNSGTSQPGRPASSRPSTPQTNSNQFQKSKSEGLLKTQNNETINNAHSKLKIAQSKAIGDSTQQNGLKLKIKIVNNSPEPSPQDKQMKKKHKKAKKSHKSPHKNNEDELAIRMKAVMKAKENLDKRNNNDLSKSMKIENATVNSAYNNNYTIAHNSNGDVKSSAPRTITDKPSLKRKFEESSSEMNQSVTASSVIPVKKFRDKFDQMVPKEFKKSVSPKTRLKNASSPALLNLHTTVKNTELSMNNLKTKTVETIEEKIIEFEPPKLKAEHLKHYPSHLLSNSHNKLLSNVQETASNCNLIQKCSEQYKKKVKRKSYPHFEEDDVKTDESDNPKMFINTIKSLSKMNIQQKSNITCSLRHEWNGVNGCQGNNGMWYDWEDEIFIKPESDTFLNAPEVDDDIPLHVLPYVELE